MRIEKNLSSFPVGLYSRMLRVMADRGFIEDYVFWDKYAFKYIFEDPRNNEARKFSQPNAKILWDSYIYLKLKCP